MASGNPFSNIVLFPGKLSESMKAFVTEGGQALEKWDKSYTLSPKAPLCFRGRDFVKLYDQDELRLVSTARRLGVNVVKIDRQGTIAQHVDLVGAPMRKVLAEAWDYEQLREVIEPALAREAAPAP